MKLKLFFFAAFASFITLSRGADLFVDPALSSGNGTTLFRTISSAVSASANGDRILIVSGVYSEPTLTLNKSLTLISQTSGDTVWFNGNIIITGFPGMKLEILGFNLGVYSISSTAIPNGNGANRAKISILNSKLNNCDFNNDYYDFNCIQSHITTSTSYRFGSFVLSTTQNLFLYDEPLSNQTGHRHFIVADSVTELLEIRNDDYPVIIANNKLKNLVFARWNHALANTNSVRNNRFSSGSHISFANNPPAYNIEFSSNEVLNTLNFLSENSWGCGGCYDGQTYGNFSTTVSAFPNPNSNGFFRWTFNGIDLPCAVPTGTNPLVLTKIIGTPNTLVNSGNPNHDYYDIDLTVNDRGLNGGPYSLLNYFPSSNLNNSKAFIFDLEIPADIFTGQHINIKARGFHKN